MPAWTPALLGPAVLRGWFKADAITGLSDGAAVAQWDDVSGNGNHGTQSNAANRPVYRTSQINGLPSLEFPSTDSFFSPISASSMTQSALMVVRRAASGASDVVLGDVVGSSSSQGRCFEIRSTNLLILRYPSGGTLVSGTVAVDTTDNLIGFRTNPTTADVSLNGTIETAAHALTFLPGQTTQIGDGFGSNNQFDGLLPELIFLENASLADFQRCEGYLAHKYGLQAKLPAAHPYKAAPPSSSGSWNPGLLGPGLTVWLDATTQTGFADAATVTTLVGRVNSKNAVASAGEEPTYETGEINGLPILRFDGVADDMTITSHGIVAQPGTVAIVARKTGPLNGGRLTHSSNMFITDSATGWQINGGTALGYGVTNTSAHVHVGTFNGASSRGSLDGTAVTGNAGAVSPSANMILASTGTGGWSAVDIGEVLVYAGTLAQADLEKIEGYLAHKWGLAANLPGGHPYKTVPPLNAVSVTAGIL